MSTPDRLALAVAFETHPHPIGQVAARVGVSLRALRFYEDRQLIAPKRVGVRRLYSDADVARLERLLRFHRLGFTLTEVGQLLAKSPAAVLSALRQRQTELAEEAATLNLAVSEIEVVIAEVRAP